MKKIINEYRNQDSPCFVKPDAAQNLETLVQTKINNVNLQKLVVTPEFEEVDLEDGKLSDIMDPITPSTFDHSPEDNGEVMDYLNDSSDDEKISPIQIK